MPVSYAKTTAWIRSRRPSLSRIRFTCVFRRGRSAARNLRLSRSRGFDTVIDCEPFHALEGADRVAYVAGLRVALRPGGRIVMLCYRVDQRDVPHPVSRDDIRAAFADGWRVDSIEPAVIDTTVHPSGARGWLAALTRLAADPSAASAPSAPPAQAAQANRNEGPT